MDRPAVAPPLIEQVRRFNRTVTERIGVLNDHYLGCNHPPGEARLIWEIGAEGITVRVLRRRLGLDSAYVSRLLRSLEAQGLVVVAPSSDDGRVRQVRLTPAGLRERSTLDQRAAALAQSLLEPLSAAEQGTLVAAMAQVERLLLATQVQIGVAVPTSRAARWCLEQYVAELNTRFEVGFDPARSISATAADLTPPAGLLLVAWLQEEPVGCGALKFHAQAPAEIKRMWVAPRARGLGLGRRLLQALERQAREQSVTVLHLETNQTLSEAIQLYRESGYQEVAAFNDEPYAHHWFEKRLA